LKTSIFLTMIIFAFSIAMVTIGTTLFATVTSQYYEPKLGDSTNLYTTNFYEEFYSTGCGAYTYFAVQILKPCKDLIISLKKTKGQPYIYVSKTNPYPTKNSLTWATESNLLTLTISKTDTNGYPGYYYIGIYNDCSQQSDIASYQIQARESYDEPNYSNQVTDIGLHDYLSANKTVEGNSFSLFSFCLDRCQNVKLRIENCVDKSCQSLSKYYILPDLLVSRQSFSVPSLKQYRYLASSAFWRC
jgi:hypothetical protein